MENIQPIPQPTQPSSKNPYKILFFITLGLFLTTIVLLVVVWFASFGAFTKITSIKPEDIIADKPVNTEVKSEITPAVTEEITSIPTKSTTASTWKTYTYSNIYGNQKCKFSLKYPSNWIVKISESGATISNLEYVKGYSDPVNNRIDLGENVSISFHENYKTSVTDGKTLDSYVSDNLSFPSVTKVKIDNLNGYKVSEYGIAGEYPAYYLVSGDNLYSISSDVGDFSETEKQIINTIKFN